VDETADSDDFLSGDELSSPMVNRKPAAFPGAAASSVSRTAAVRVATAGASRQWLTLVHLSAQNERFVWDRGCA
jgi:hypothetical protein